MVLREMCVVSLIHGFLAVCSLCARAISLLFASVCCILFTRFMFFNILFMSVFFSIFVFHFVYSMFLYVLCFASPLVLSVSYFCTSPPTTDTGWRPNCINKYHVMSYVCPFENCVAYVCVIFYVKTLIILIAR